LPGPALRGVNPQGSCTGTVGPWSRNMRRGSARTGPALASACAEEWFCGLVRDHPAIPKR